MQQKGTPCWQKAYSPFTVNFSIMQVVFGSVYRKKLYSGYKSVKEICQMEFVGNFQELFSFSGDQKKEW